MDLELLDPALGDKDPNRRLRLRDIWLSHQIL